MPIFDQYPPLEYAPRANGLRKALASLTRCGCLTIWKQYTDQALKGKNFDIDCIRLRWCLSEHCWGLEDVDNTSLTESDKSQPFPEVAKRSLMQKLKAARSLVPLKQLAFLWRLRVKLD